jgi:hypothetical protein
MSFYTCFDWFKKLRLVVNERNNEAPLGIFKFISDYLPYFEKINIFFNIIAKKFELIYKY